jgi:hypothetical protein
MELNGGLFDLVLCVLCASVVNAAIAVYDQAIRTVAASADPVYFPAKEENG